MSLEDLIEPAIDHRSINGLRLISEREKRGLEAYQVAKECGWTPQYQCQLEAPGKRDIPTKNANRIIQALSQFSEIK